MRHRREEFDDEIRGHIALSVKERIERGEDPEAARLAALREFGNLLLTRESLQSVWRPRIVEKLALLGHDVRIALRSLRHAKGLAATVAVMLALGIGANAAVFSVVRQVLFQPLVNRDEDRLVYIRQAAPGIGAANMTFSMPEIRDLAAGSTQLGAFGDFSTIDFSAVGFGEPRVVKAGVVSGSYFGVMGLRPVLGRLLDPGDDGPDAACVAVLTHRFWSTALRRDPGVVGRTLRLGSRSATIIGVLEPSLPYPADTELIANVATSPHHMGATMVTQRTHRMTELFGRLSPGASVASARAELEAAYARMLARHPETYSEGSRFQLSVTPLRDQLTAPARSVLLLLLAAAFVVLAIACSNVANLILARSVRRERELQVRAALGAGRAALRRTLLAESLVLCGGGAVLGVLLARPLVDLVARYAARFSVRALDVQVDPSLLWVGAGLALVTAVVLAFVPRLPSAPVPSRSGSSGLRITPGTSGRLRVFAVAQVALSFVLLAGAGMLLSAMLALQAVNTGIHTHKVLALDVPLPIEAFGPKAVDFYERAMRRIEELPGVGKVAVGSFVPWRDAGSFGPGVSFAVEGYARAVGEEEPRARFRNVTPGFFAALGVPLVAGRDFSADDRAGGEPVVIVSQSLAQRMFPDGAALGRQLWWTDPYFAAGSPTRRRIVGVAADLDDESVVPGPAVTVYHPLRQLPFGGRLFVHAAGDPYALVGPVTRVIRQLSPEQPVERPATLADVRAQVLAPERLNAFVLSGFAGVALLIAVVGVGGVLAFSVSARTREFGVRLAVGSSRRHLLAHVLGEGALIAGIGILAGAAAGYGLGRLAASQVASLQPPGGWALFGAAGLLMAAAIVASLLPAARASRVDVVQALRSE